jgi:HD-like signal output (HDOD) protein
MDLNRSPSIRHSRISTGLSAIAGAQQYVMSPSQPVPTYKTGNHSVPAAADDSEMEARGAALAFLEMLAKELSNRTVDLPCFPNVVIRVKKALDDPNTTAQQVVQMVGAEPRLAAKLLQMANSVAFNHAGKPLTDLRSAITRLGHQLVQSAAMGFAVQQMKQEGALRPIATQLGGLWNRSIAVASICQVVARKTKVCPDEAFLTGLMHGIGQLYIIVRSVGQARQLCNAQNFAGLVGSWHASIGKSVLESWGFAGEIAQAVADQADFERRSKSGADLTDVTIVSILLADHLGHSAPEFEVPGDIFSFQSIGLSRSDCTAILTHAECQLGSLHDALGC